MALLKIQNTELEEFEAWIKVAVTDPNFLGRLVPQRILGILSPKRIS